MNCNRGILHFLIMQATVCTLKKSFKFQLDAWLKQIFLNGERKHIYHLHSSFSVGASNLVTSRDDSSSMLTVVSPSDDYAFIYTSPLYTYILCSTLCSDCYFVLPFFISQPLKYLVSLHISSQIMLNLLVLCINEFACCVLHWIYVINPHFNGIVILLDYYPIFCRILNILYVI